MRKVKAYLSIAKTSWKEGGSNPKRFMSSIIQMIFRTLLVVAIYRIAYKVGGGNQRMTFANAMWTIGLCFTFFINLGIRNIYQPVEAEIKNGNVETNLIKPLDWRLVKIMELFGKSGQEFLMQLVIMPIVLWVAVGPPDLSYMSPILALTFLLFFVMSVVTASAMFMSVGLSAFWLNDAKSIFRIVDKMALICCGTFVPIALLPDAFQQFISFTPFIIYAAPTRFFDPTMPSHMLVTLASGLLWMFGMLAICQLIWSRSNKKIEVNGG